MGTKMWPSAAFFFARAYMSLMRLRSLRAAEHAFPNTTPTYYITNQATCIQPHIQQHVRSSVYRYIDVPASTLVAVAVADGSGCG